MVNWEGLCSALYARFERDEENQLIRHFFRIRQTNSVSEYIESFIDLVHQILVHDPTLAPSVITNRFIAASSLALLQEKVTVEYPKSDTKKTEATTPHKRYSFDQGRASGMSTRTTPTRSPVSPHSDDKRMGESSKPKSAEDKLSILKA